MRISFSGSRERLRASGTALPAPYGTGFAWIKIRSRSFALKVDGEESHGGVPEDSLGTVPLARNRPRPLIEVYGTCGESAAHMGTFPLCRLRGSSMNVPGCFVFKGQLQANRSL